MRYIILKLSLLVFLDMQATEASKENITNKHTDPFVGINNNQISKEKASRKRKIIVKAEQINDKLTKVTYEDGSFDYI